MAKKAIKDIQQKLKDKGFDPGGIDGIWGRKTMAAVKQFQRQQGLGVDGIIGPNTRAALFAGDAAAEAAAASLLPWFEEARNLLGTREIQGAGDNPEIMDWADDLDIHYEGDDVAWCGLFVAHCVGYTLPDEALPGNPLGARKWEKFGDETTPRVGAIMVFWRRSPSDWRGHVGFYVGEDDGAYQILGGNQSDSVNLTWVSKERLLSARWPKSATSLTSSSVSKARTEGLSTDEA